MKSIAFGLIVLVASSLAYVPTYPRPEYDPPYFNSKVDSRSSSSSEERTHSSRSLRNSVSRISSSLLDRVPNARDILSMTSETLQRRSAADVMRSLSDICNAAISTDAIKPTYAPEKQQINMRLMTREGENAVPLSQPQKLFDLPVFRQENENVVFISGWKKVASQEDSALNKLKEAYQCRGNVNFIAIDLGRHMDNLQTWLSVDNEQVGQWVGEAITELAKRTSNQRIHVIGHGVGAHVAGAAARKYTEMTGNMLPRITALDPAMLCYKEPQTLSGLQRNDAEFVDVIHTSSYGLGMQEPIGDVDFYPNGPTGLQPGTRDVISAHNKAVEYFAESVLPGNEENFLAQKCNSKKNLHSNVCQQQKDVPMGFATPKEVEGNFFLETRDSAPYGNNAKSSSSTQCHGRY